MVVVVDLGGAGGGGVHVCGGRGDFSSGSVDG